MWQGREWRARWASPVSQGAKSSLEAQASGGEGSRPEHLSRSQPLGTGTCHRESGKYSTKQARHAPCPHRSLREALLPVGWLYKAGVLAAREPWQSAGTHRTLGTATKMQGKSPLPQRPATCCRHGVFLTGWMSLFQEPKGPKGPGAAGKGPWGLR